MCQASIVYLGLVERHKLIQSPCWAIQKWFPWQQHNAIFFSSASFSASWSGLDASSWSWIVPVRKSQKSQDWWDGYDLSHTQNFCWNPSPGYWLLGWRDGLKDATEAGDWVLYRWLGHLKISIITTHRFSSCRYSDTLARGHWAVL